MMRLAGVRNPVFRFLVICRRKNALIIEGLCNSVRTDPGCPHFKDSADICRCFTVHDRQPFFIIALDISIRSIRAPIDTFLGVGFNDGFDFLARVGGVPFVEDIHDRCHIHARIFGHSRIHIVAYGNEPDIVGREQVIRVLPDFNIVSPEAAQVLDDDDIDPAVLGILQQPLDAGAVEIGTTPAVVDILVYDLKTVLMGVLFKNLFLILDRQGFSRSFILLGQSVIKTCFLFCICFDIKLTPFCYVKAA